MKLVVAVLTCWWLLVATTPARAQTYMSARLDTVQIGGRSYVSLPDWAKSGGLQFRWLRRGKVAEISGRSSRLQFTADTAVAQINGINVWLSYPVADRNGDIYVSELDLRTTLQPLVFSRNSGGQKGKTITLDPGHGGKDTGNSVGSQTEKKYTLLLAQELADQLRAAGFKVKLTRSSDKFVDLEERPAFAKVNGADLFISLHFNASAVARNEVRGSEVYCLTPVGASSTNSKGIGADSGASSGNRCNNQNIQLAYFIQKNLTTKLGTEDRGVRRARFAVLRDVTMPAVLIEAGFMSHPVEGRKIFDPAYRRLMAKAIANGIAAYQSAAGR